MGDVPLAALHDQIAAGTLGKPEFFEFAGNLADAEAQLDNARWRVDAANREAATGAGIDGELVGDYEGEISALVVGLWARALRHSPTAPCTHGGPHAWSVAYAHMAGDHDDASGVVSARCRKCHATALVRLRGEPSTLHGVVHHIDGRPGDELYGAIAATGAGHVQIEGMDVTPPIPDLVRRCAISAARQAAGRPADALVPVGPDHDCCFMLTPEALHAAGRAVRGEFSRVRGVYRVRTLPPGVASRRHSQSHGISRAHRSRRRRSGRAASRSPGGSDPGGDEPPGDVDRRGVATDVESCRQALAVVTWLAEVRS